MSVVRVQMSFEGLIEFESHSSPAQFVCRQLYRRWSAVVEFARLAA